MERNSLTLDKHATGTASESLVAAYLSHLGYPVYLPLRASPRADLVYLTPKAVRAQVKTSTRCKTGPRTYEQCRLVCYGRGAIPTSKPYTAEEIDELWIVGTHLWRFPVDVIAGRTSISLFNSQVPKDYNPEDYVEVRGSAERPFRERLFQDTPAS